MPFFLSLSSFLFPMEYIKITSSGSGYMGCVSNMVWVFAGCLELRVQLHSSSLHAFQSCSLYSNKGVLTMNLECYIILNFFKPVIPSHHEGTPIWTWNGLSCGSNRLPGKKMNEYVYKQNKPSRSLLSQWNNFLLISKYLVCVCVYFWPATSQKYTHDFITILTLAKISAFRGCG